MSFSSFLSRASSAFWIFRSNTGSGPSNNHTARALPENVDDTMFGGYSGDARLRNASDFARRHPGVVVGDQRVHELRRDSDR